MIQGVPYDAEVEYLESSGSSTYFDLADLGRNIIKSTSDTLEVSLTGLLIAKYAWDKLCRCTSHTGANVMGVAVYPEFSYGFGNIRTTSMIAGNKHNYRVYYGSTGGNSTLSVDGSVLLSSTSILTVYGFADFSLFARPNGTEQTARGNRIYNVVVRVNNKVVRCLQPVRVGNVGYLYDRVTRRLFGNQGTGAFLYGPDVATPVMGLHFYASQLPSARDYVRDGLVAMWDGIENAGWGVHDTNVRAVDLCGTHPALTGFASMESDAMIFNKQSRCTFAAQEWADFRAAINAGNFTFTSCIELSSGTLEWRTIVYSEAGSNKSRFNIRPNTNRRIIQVYIRDKDAANGLFSEPSIVPSDLRFSNVSVSCRLNGVTTTWCDETKSTTTSGTFPIQTTEEVLYIGGGSTLGSIMADGRWHNMRWYSRALTDAEIAYNYNIDKLRFNLPTGGAA